MPEIKNIEFDYQEIAEALVRFANIHDGLWGVAIKFGLQGTNIGTSPDDLMPAAIVPVVKLGLQSFEEPNNLTVDASEINPE